jgi:hypothetical protein
MKFTLALYAITAALASANPFAPAKSANDAKSAYVSKLMRGAKVVRALEEQQQDWQDVQVDISGYSIKFEKCQFVKSYDDELAQEEDSNTVLAPKRFVVFRLCPTSSCASSCSSGYGEYLIDLESYLEATVQYQQELQENMCQACQECGNYNQDGQDQAQDDADAGDNGERRLANNNVYVDCDSCYDECMKIENMEDNGYVDATNFLECQMIYDPEDDGKSALYAGPMCASSGTKIKIGVFTDENCNMLDSSKDVDDYLMDDNGYQMKLSHALLKTVYASDSCLSCLYQEEDDGNDNNNNNNNNQDANNNQILDVCEELYQTAAKCETSHGFDNGLSQYYGYDNQLAQESVVCDFIDSVMVGSYDETGEIVVNGSSGSIGGGAKTTGGQKFALTFFILGTVGLAVYAAMLHSKLTKGVSAGLAGQGGAMA